MKPIRHILAFLTFALALVFSTASHAGALTDYAENKIADALLRGQSLGAPATMYIGLATAILAPAVSIVQQSGRVHAGLEAMLSGEAQVSGLTVLQRVIGGVAGNAYKLRCQIDDAVGERWVIADTMAVETA